MVVQWIFKVNSIERDNAQQSEKCWCFWINPMNVMCPSLTFKLMIFNDQSYVGVLHHPQSRHGVSFRWYAFRLILKLLLFAGSFFKCSTSTLTPEPSSNLLIQQQWSEIKKNLTATADEPKFHKKYDSWQAIAWSCEKANWTRFPDGAYYRKRGSTSHTVREVRSMRERERETEVTSP